MTAGTVDSKWTGLETTGMKEARCSLLIQEEECFEAKIKALPSQRVMVFQDKGFSSSSTGSDENYYVDFTGATILQLEPQLTPTCAHSTMPVTMTVGGRAVFTPENYQDFRVMMRTKGQSKEMEISPNGNFDWPDVNAFLTCPCCGKRAPVPQPGERDTNEYWMLFYPLLQISVVRGTQLTLGTRTICRLTCLSCVDDILEGLTLTIQPGKPKNKIIPSRSTRLAFTLPALDVLAEAGSASFLEDGPPRPDTHPHVDDILDTWTLYNLWEHSGAWEALQNDYRVALSRSMNSDSQPDTGCLEPTTPEASRKKPEAHVKDRMGKPCSNPSCDKVHGQRGSDGEVTRLTVKCKECHSELYCSKACRDMCKQSHAEECIRKQRDREERRERKAKMVSCDACRGKFPFTKMKKCSGCRKVTYCSVECQKKHWDDQHRFQCQNVADR